MIDQVGRAKINIDNFEKAYHLLSFDWHDKDIKNFYKYCFKTIYHGLWFYTKIGHFFKNF